MTKIQKLFFLNRLPHNLPNTKIIAVDLPWINIIFIFLLKQRFLRALRTLALRGQKPDRAPRHCMEPDISTHKLHYHVRIKRGALSVAVPSTCLVASWLPLNFSVLLPLTFAKRSTCYDATSVFWHCFFPVVLGEWKLWHNRVLPPSSWIQECSHRIQY